MVKGNNLNKIKYMTNDKYYGLIARKYFYNYYFFNKVKRSVMSCIFFFVSHDTYQLI